MERLTYFENGHWRLKINGVVYSEWDFVDRLAAYENTGLSPESVEALKLSIMGKAVSEITEFNGLPIDRLRELAEADKEGRVVVLPCKVGDTAYRLQYIEETPGRYVVGWVADVGKTIFATRKEAELALKEVQNGNKNDM